MKILFILEYYYPNIGGVEKLFKSLCEGLVKNGHEVLVITSQFDPKLPLEESINGVRIKRLKLSNRFLFTFFSCFSILKIARNYDLIHTTSYNAALPAWITAKLLRKKSIITFHEVWGDLWNTLPYLSFIEKKLFKFYEYFILKLKFDKYIAVSEFTKNKLIESGIDKRKIEKIYNGINYDDYKIEAKLNDNSFSFTYFGRLGASKGLDIILPAAKLFLKKHPNAKFNLIIPKIPKAFYKKIISELSDLEFKDNIKLMHNLSFDTLKAEIANSSCVLIPSYSEGFCFAAVETTALKTPIISSNLGALKETVSGKHIIMEQFNIQGLVDALERAYNNDFDNSTITEFTINTSINNYLEFYKNLKVVISA